MSIECDRKYTKTIHICYIHITYTYLTIISQKFDREWGRYHKVVGGKGENGVNMVTYMNFSEKIK